MAKTRYVKPITNKTLKALNAIGDNVSEYVAISLKEMAYKAQEVAQDRLKETYGETTQELTPQEAASQIGVAVEGKIPRGHKYNRYTATVYAPIDKKYANSMVYLEYGAGLGNTKRKPVKNKYGADVWMFPVSGEQKQRMRMFRTKGLAMQIYKGNLELGKPAVFEANFKGNKYMGITNKSQRVGYMKHARMFLLQKARANTIKNINLALRRPYYKHIARDLGEEE